MKKKSLILLILLCFVVNISAQKETFSADELKVLKKNAYEKLKDLRYRRTLISKSVSPKGYTSKNVFEFVPPDRRHSIIETETSEGKTVVERIYIGEKHYYKKGIEDWKEITGSGSGIGSGGGQGSAVTFERSVEYKISRGQKINNQKTDLYEIITTYTFNSGNETYSTISKERYWFNKAGLFVKTETENSDRNSEIRYQSTEEYEYDPNIKIEAPIK